MFQRQMSVFLFGIVLAVPSASWGQTSFDELLMRLPANANALVMINAAKARASGFAKAHGVTDRDAPLDANRYLFPRREIEKAVLAAQLNLQDFTPEWEASVVAVRAPTALEKIAKAAGGHTEMLGDVGAVRLPTDAYLVPFGPQVIGLMEPANRQLCSRWAHQAVAAKAATLSPYLQHIRAISGNRWHGDHPGTGLELRARCG